MGTVHYGHCRYGCLTCVHCPYLQCPYKVTQKVQQFGKSGPYTAGESLFLEAWWQHGSSTTSRKLENLMWIYKKNWDLIFENQICRLPWIYEITFGFPVFCVEFTILAGLRKNKVNQISFRKTFFALVLCVWSSAAKRLRNACLLSCEFLLCLQIHLT